MLTNMHVNPGSLDKPISIYSLIYTKDEEGFGLPLRSLVLQTYASFKRQSGTEAEQNNADFGTVRARFLIRTPSAKITRKMLLVYGGEDYDIVYVNPYGDNRQYTEIIAEIRTNAGKTAEREFVVDSEDMTAVAPVVGQREVYGGANE